MATELAIAGVLQRPAPVKLTTTGLTTIVTQSQGAATIEAISAANETGASVNVSVYYNDGAADYLIFRQDVPANSMVVFSGVPVAMRDGDSIKAQADAANALTIYAVEVAATSKGLP